MSAQFDAVDFYRQAQAALPAGGAWLAGFRAAGLDRFAAQGFPNSRQENWKYTNLRRLARRGYTPSLAGVATPDPATPLLATPTLDLIDGMPVGAAPDIEGVEIATLLEALNGPDAAEIRKTLEDFSSRAGSDLRPLNDALLADALVVRVVAGAQVAEPLLIRHAHSSDAGPSLANARILVLAQPNSSATIVEHHVGATGGKRFANTIVEATLGANAALDYCKLQTEHEDTTHIAGLHFVLARDSRLRAWNFDLGGGLVRHDHLVELREPGGEVDLNGLFLLEGRQHVDNHTRVDHFAPHTHSRELYRGVLDGRSRGVFNGRAIVHPQAQKISAQQVSNNLLLAKTAEIDTKPELEIYADDVICSHGATVGQLDRDALFYLRTRGLAETTARALLIYTFANELVTSIPHPALRAAINAEVLGRLPARAELRGLL